MKVPLIPAPLIEIPWVTVRGNTSSKVPAPTEILSPVVACVIAYLIVLYGELRFCPLLESLPSILT